MSGRKRDRNEAPHAYVGLDRVLHEKARLGILVALSSRADGVLFADLKGLCELTDGNLSRHLAVLSEADIVEIWKTNDGGARGRTLIRLTENGRRSFRVYLSELERVLGDAKSSTRSRGRGTEPGPEWSLA